jgi:hypothetical protein
MRLSVKVSITHSRQIVNVVSNPFHFNLDNKTLNQAVLY